ncbi:hypothetical protein FM042_00595 [Aliidiomarina halalkaliphila]|uniref:Uncharacterized protein n=1 Tax=Aliidiomarina halalkaliphila TaxID=2593535 RepID=A0A552X2Z6_9GAMM|nr:hypothetical protein [Aliidiomarina halalkaliphila]TRW49404.1 hypothetical protein FM042_00595 [Aliidiomarina halalkaliphila]
MTSSVPHKGPTRVWWHTLAKLSALVLAGAALLLPWWRHSENAIPVMDESALPGPTPLLTQERKACLFDVHVMGALHLESELSTRLQFVQENFDPQILPFCAVLFPQRYQENCVETNGHVYCEDIGVEEPHAIAMVITGDNLAQTRNGIIYAPRRATGLLLQHELGHALGLADEYAMRPELAKAFCGGNYRFEALNIVFTSSRELSEENYQDLRARLPWKDYLTTEIAQETENGQWLLGSVADHRDAVGLYPAETCTYGPGYAWKPVAEKTFMEQHEIGSVPTLYLKLIRDRLHNEQNKSASN